jgi:hypothetical protein
MAGSRSVPVRLRATAYCLPVSTVLLESVAQLSSPVKLQEPILRARVGRLRAADFLSQPAIAIAQDARSSRSLP